ncbi:GspH/FimT family pseudopilin [Chitinilyticum piscinae]|uniref:Type II secretion system protein H n=1 Tax=Chitinilyticum piscinae TaxID=2866724 RepID=A0A8J7FI66_9NEIS|nr:GspH/FimT family pseudopilin [Chitinilyticum piscinae]MBE9609745.1 GspH/FimT family pseudopilin [Chitinilyticum piscinae]
MNTFNTLRRQHGVTLIELMVVISVLGILAGVAVPNMLDWIRDARLATQSDLLVSGLANARLDAIKRRSDSTFCPAASANSASDCSASASDWSKGWLIRNSGAIEQRFTVQKDITISNTTASSVIFNGTLGSAQAASTFTICADGRKEHIVEVSLSGHISKRIGTNVCGAST